MENSQSTQLLRDSATSYGLVSRLNHWIIAVAMVGMLISGLVMAYGPLSRETVAVIRDWHKPVGVFVLAYGLWRVGWRIKQGFPSDAAPMAGWQAIASKLTHWALLCTVILMPVSGIVMSVYGGHDVSAFGFVIPGQQKVDWLRESASLTHQYGGFALIGLLVLHVSAAMKHHFIDHDATLRRMIGRT